MTIKNFEFYRVNTRLVVLPYVSIHVHHNDSYDISRMHATTGLQTLNTTQTLRNLREYSQIQFQILNETSTADTTIFRKSLNFEDILKRGTQQVVEKVEFNNFIAKGVMELEFNFVNYTL